jgi:hypothetical protein
MFNIRATLFYLKQYFLHKSGYYLIRYKSGLNKYIADTAWRNRIDDVLIAPDNKFIPRTKDAGKIQGNYQIMHNGIKIFLGSYYGYGITHLLKENLGVHEPQEERVFQEVLKYIPEGAVMIELGSFWAFYSLWFHNVIKGAKCFLIEPEYINLLKGRTNFKLNGSKGYFINAFVGEESILSNVVPTYTIDDIVNAHKIERIHILHADIQGSEMKMLKGAKNALEKQLIDFIFLSTHSNELHDQCEKYLLQYNFEIIANTDLDKTFSVDGVLVAKRKAVNGPEFISLSLKN